jgi:hypothetical protein
MARDIIQNGTRKSNNIQKKIYHSASASGGTAVIIVFNQEETTLNDIHLINRDIFNFYERNPGMLRSSLLRERIWNTTRIFNDLVRPNCVPDM